MSSLDTYITALKSELDKASPKDTLQYCADYFNKLLAAEREGHLGQTLKNSTSGGGGAAAMSSPFGNGSSKSKGLGTMTEEDEEMGAPDGTQQKGLSGGGGGGGGLFGGGGGGGFGNFGSWGKSMSGDQEGASSFGATSNADTPANYKTSRRVSVSAESMEPDADSGNWKPPNHPKTPEQTERLRAAVANNFLFAQLDDDSFSVVLGALTEKPIPAPNIKVISQGDAGDYFYVIEKGEFNIHIHPSGALQPGPDGMGNKVATIGPGGSFGELALMYNAPRAATVVSAAGSKGSTLWQLDRVTFRRIIMDSASQKRKMYEGFLQEVPLLSSLKAYERAKIADALETVKIPAGTNIITEGEAGDAFYMLEAGEASAYKHGVDGPVKEYKRGDFFGELALLDDKPRQASVVAKTEVKLAKLGRDGFKRLLGPVQGIMRREEYAAPDDTTANDMDPLGQTKTVT